MVAFDEGGYFIHLFEGSPGNFRDFFRCSAGKKAYPGQDLSQHIMKLLPIFCRSRSLMPSISRSMAFMRSRMVIRSIISSMRADNAVISEWDSRRSCRVELE
jgi:hypothetical protein